MPQVRADSELPSVGFGELVLPSHCRCARSAALRVSSATTLINALERISCSSGRVLNARDFVPNYEMEAQLSNLAIGRPTESTDVL
jgi:hypothetical protein